MKRLITVTALALAAISFVSTTASAQVTGGANDLVLGFRSTNTSSSSTGYDANLEVDLGPIANFTTSTNYDFGGASGLAAADLVATYGAGWATRTDLVWGVIGASATANHFDTTVNANNLNVRVSNGAGLGTFYNNVGATASYLIQLNPTTNSTAAATDGGASSGNDTGAGASTVSSGSYTYDQQNSAGLTGNPDYGYSWNSLANAGATEFQSSSGPDGSIELFAWAPGVKVSGSYPLPTGLGNFTLSGSGTTSDFTYVGLSATPEPSSYALGLCAGLLFWVLKRRKTIA